MDDLLAEVLGHMIERGHIVQRVDMERELVGETFAGDPVREKVILYVVANTELDRKFIDVLNASGLKHDDGGSGN